MLHDRFLGEDLRIGAIVSKFLGRNAVEIATGNHLLVERVSVGRESDTIRTEVRIGVWKACRARVKRISLNICDPLVKWVRLRESVQMAPGVSSSKINNDDTVAAFG